MVRCNLRFIVYVLNFRWLDWLLDWLTDSNICLCVCVCASVRYSHTHTNISNLLINLNLTTFTRGQQHRRRRGLPAALRQSTLMHGGRPMLRTIHAHTDSFLLHSDDSPSVATVSGYFKPLSFLYEFVNVSAFMCGRRQNDLSCVDCNVTLCLTNQAF